jgi:U4/U6.U5 tri-snRNP component SNU23
MSTNLNYKQVANVVRRTWDIEAYEKRAQERLKNEAVGNNHTKSAPPPAVASIAAGKNDVDKDYDDSNREEFTPAAAGATKAHHSQRAYLKARSNKVESLDSKIGSVEVINPDAAATVRSKVSDVLNKDTAVTKSGVGWHCRVCDCFLRDSHAYLDHINGRKHQRNLGYSMRVERSTTDQVAARLAALVKEKEKSKGQTSFDELLVEEEEELYRDIVKAKDEKLRNQQEQRKQDRKERRKKKKAEEKKLSEVIEQGDDKQEGTNSDEDGGIHPNLAAMMGFSGFGGGNKGR